MLDLVWLIPLAPLLGAAVLALVGSRLPHTIAGAIGVGSVGISAVTAVLIAAQFWTAPPPDDAYTRHLWTWIHIGAFRVEIAFYLDALSLVMISVITFVAFLIHLYSTEFMHGDEGYSRFFAYMNLFVASMVTLILANNLLLLYLGWEGVGLCSYLLIGFWYQDPANGRAGRKAFIVTRVGDTFLAIGLFVIFYGLGTLDIQEIAQRAHTTWGSGSPYVIAAAALLLGGAVGKSAQLPLQTWLPDAMAGPTPTSALIHAATMVTAGVYLIARMHVLFELSPQVQLAVAVVGAATLLLAGFSALTQTDLKRVLAYSTMSQIGYMFLALGVGAWSAAIFHFLTHAFFKALLFLVAGIVIEALHDEHDIFRMGGLRKELPVAFWTFLIGGCALAGLPLVTAGFYSKDWIIASASGNTALWIAALAGALLTSLYTFRLIFLVFLGPVKTPVTRRPGLLMRVPVWILAFLSITAGFAKSFFERAAPAVGGSELASSVAAGLAFFAGLGIAWLYWQRPPAASVIERFWLAGWGFDWLYDHLLVRPVIWAARINRGDFIDSIYDGMAAVAASSSRVLSWTETGKLRWYAAGIAAGSALFLAIVIFL